LNLLNPVRFQRHETPPPYLNRRDQFRLLALVALAGLVMVAIDLAANPQNWNWLFNPGGAGGRNAAHAPVLDEVDFRVKESDHEPLPPGVFLAEAETDADVVPEAGAAPVANRTALPAELFENVEDNRLGPLRREQPAIDHIVARLRELSQAELEAAARDDVAFTVLMLHSDDYRGKLLTIDGALWDLRLLQAGDPDDPRDNVYEGWVLTADSGNNPYRVLVTELPPGLQPGKQLDVKVQATGYFFKLYGYAAQSGQHVAPMLIAKTFRTFPPPAVPPDRIGKELGRYALGFILIVGGVFAVILWWFSVSDRKFRHSHMQELAEARLDARQEDIAALQELDTLDPHKLFADHEQQTEIPNVEIRNPNVEIRNPKSTESEGPSPP
jgi:hypothetical protein